MRLPTTDSPPITIRHLLTMTAGFPTDDPWGDRQQGLDLGAFSKLLAGGLSFAWAPGTRFEYSNTGYGILGRLITNVAGREYRDVVRERLLRPLGMDSTRLPRIRGARGAQGARLRLAGRPLRPRADRRLRGARVDGRHLHHGRGPREVGDRLPRRRRRRATIRRVRTRSAGRHGARCSSRWCPPDSGSRSRPRTPPRSSR